jgi:hypothetical protein
VTLTIEFRHGAWWLVALATPASKPAALALFVNEDAAYAWKAAFARSQCFAREVGRAGV